MSKEKRDMPTEEPGLAFIISFTSTAVSYVCLTVISNKGYTMAKNILKKFHQIVLYLVFLVMTTSSSRALVRAVVEKDYGIGLVSVLGMSLSWAIAIVHSNYLFK